jgi:DNA-binding beta-propeller fold protein YncE
VAAFAFGSGSPPALAGVDFDHVGIVDPNSNEIVGEIAVGHRPAAVAIGDGSVWVANAGSQTVIRINPRTRHVVGSPIGIGQPASSLAVTKTAVWVGNGSAGTVSEIDPSSNTVVGKLNLKGGNPVVPNGVQSLAFGYGSLWVAVGPRALLRFDPSTRRKTWIPVGSPPLAVTVGAGAVWVATGDEQLIRIDPSSNKPAESQSIQSAVALTVGFGSLWVMNGDDLSDFNANTSVLEGSVPDGGFPIAVGTGYGAVWSLDNFGAALYRTDPFHIQRQTKIPLGRGRPADLAVGDGEIWICVQ